VRRDILASVGTGALFILFDVLLNIKSLGGIMALGSELSMISGR
jgi:hypothetical protein